MSDLKINSINTYQSGTFPFPEDEIPVSEKNADWGRRWCEAIYAAYVSDRCAVPYSQIDELYELRDYGAGRQDIEKYQKILLDENEKGDGYEGWMNINWDVLSVMPKFKNIVRGIFEEQDHDIVATAVDPLSFEQRQIIKISKWFKKKYKPLIDAVNSFAGYQPEPEWLPNSMEELLLYEKGGGFKLSQEKNIEEAIHYSFYLSDWKEIKRKMLDDFMDIGMAAVKDYTDQYTRKAKMRYVDPLKLIMQYSRHSDHRNSEFAGELIKVSISEIRKNTNLSEDTLRGLAQYYNGRGGNPNLSSWDENDLRFGSGWKYDNFQIDVMDAEWVSINDKKLMRRKTKYGELVYDQEDDKIYDSEKRKTELKRYKTIYRAKWIIGTNYVYDFGLQYDIPRPGKKEVELSFKFFKLPGRSLVDLAVPNLDQLCLTNYKLQNAIAMAPPSGVAVEYTSLNNMKLGGNKLEPLDILAIRRGQGDLIYKLTTIGGRPNVPGGMRPVQELEGGIGRQLDEYIRLFELHINFIRDLTGINQIADASTPDPNQSVGGSQLAVAATNKALKPIYAGYIALKEKVAKTTSLRIQMLVRHDKKAYEGYIPVVGQQAVRLFRAGEDIVECDYAIMIVARPTAQRKQIILEAAKQAMIPDREGYVGIEVQDFMLIERMVEEGNLKFAEMYLNARSQANKALQIKRQRENMDYAAKRDQEVALTKENEQRKTKQLDNDLKKDFEQFKKQLEDDSEYKKHKWRMEEIELEKSLQPPKESGNVNKEVSVTV